MRIYIAGKITGLVYEDALRAFAEAAAELTRLGHEAVNPMKGSLPSSASLQSFGNSVNSDNWTAEMERCIPELLQCEAIYLLPNWKESTGARIEKVIAEHSKMLILTAGFKGRRGEVFGSTDNGERITDSEKPPPKYCGSCGRKLTVGERDLGVDECFRCHNGISSVSGVGIQSAARV